MPRERYTEDRYAFPLLLDVTGRAVVIVGGGRVAARKAAGLLDAGADPGRVRCVAPAFHPDVPAAVVRVAEAYAARHLDGADLVFAATDSPAVNGAVVRDARGRGLLVSRADADTDDSDGGAYGDFTVPARLRRGPVTVTVSAGSPAMAALIRDALADRWDPRWTAMTAALRDLRPALLRAAPADPALRRRALRDLATEPALDVLTTGGPAALSDWLVARHPELAPLLHHPPLTTDH